VLTDPAPFSGLGSKSQFIKAHNYEPVLGRDPWVNNPCARGMRLVARSVGPSVVGSAVRLRKWPTRVVTRQSAEITDVFSD
jgi:hypothetical protein